MTAGDPIELTYAEPEINRSASRAHRRIILIGVGVIVMAFELGVIWNNEYSTRPTESLPIWLSALVEASVAIAAVAMLASLLLLFQRRVASIAAASVITLGAFFVAAQLFRLSPLRPIYVSARIVPSATQATQSFVNLLVQAWGSTLLATIVALLIHRDREQFMLVAAALFFGLASAVADAMYFFSWSAGPWYFRTWPRMLSSGLMLVTFLLLVALLARSFNVKRERRQLQSLTPVSST